MDKNDYTQGERDQSREHNPQPRRPSFMLKASMRSGVSPERLSAVIDMMRLPGFEQNLSWAPGGKFARENANWHR